MLIIDSFTIKKISTELSKNPHFVDLKISPSNNNLKEYNLIFKTKIQNNTIYIHIPLQKNNLKLTTITSTLKLFINHYKKQIFNTLNEAFITSQVMLRRNFEKNLNNLIPIETFYKVYENINIENIHINQLEYTLLQIEKELVNLKTTKTSN